MDNFKNNNDKSHKIQIRFFYDKDDFLYYIFIFSFLDLWDRGVVKKDVLYINPII